MTCTHLRISLKQKRYLLSIIWSLQMTQIFKYQGNTNETLGSTQKQTFLMLKADVDNRKILNIHELSLWFKQFEKIEEQRKNQRRGCIKNKNISL